MSLVTNRSEVNNLHAEVSVLGHYDAENFTEAHTDKLWPLDSQVQSFRSSPALPTPSPFSLLAFATVLPVPAPAQRLASTPCVPITTGQATEPLSG